METVKLFLFLFAILHATKSSPVIDRQDGNLKYDQLKDPYSIDLAESEECSHDVERICGKTLVKTNFDVISCLQTSFKDYEISEKCQNLIWNYKKNVTIDEKYEKAVKQMCNNMIQQLPECQSLDPSRGHLIACLVEHLADEPLQPLPHNCGSFLKRLEPVVFSDYRIIYKFTEACQNDIDRLHCGRVNAPNDHQVAPFHSQGSVLTCLATKVNDLHAKCKFELLRVSELQGDDYHYDRQLYFACRNDREKFCSNVQSGEGRVYRCLVKNKAAPEMSEKCQQSLLLRQQLEQEDYKVNVKLSQACKEDIVKNDCNKEMDTMAGFPAAKMSVIILCLESVEHDGGKIKGECKAELKDVRRGMMEDYRVNPLVVLFCSRAIEKHCGGDVRPDGTTIHCLLDLARPKMNASTNQFEYALEEDCRGALHQLILEADVVGNYEVDPILHHTCLSVARVYCSNVHMDEAYNCLYNSIDKPSMTEECRSSMYQIEYFKNRDIRMDADLYKECRQDATDICHAPHHWHIKGGTEKNSNMFLVLNCLYRHSWKSSTDPGYKSITPNCASQVRRVMRERALSVNLKPEIEINCMADLSKFCVSKNQKEEEMECLEENWENLNPKCQEVISQYIEDVDKDPELNEIFLRFCKPTLEKHCSHVGSSLSLEHIDEKRSKDLMHCLVANKNSEEMNEECRTGVEHHQLMTQKNIKFSHHLFAACEHDAKAHCHAFTDKVHIVQCLSEVRVNDTLLDKESRLSENCLSELTFELFQRNENIDLDPELHEACGEDIKYLCPHALHKAAATQECLTQHMPKLGKRCRQVLYLRIQSESVDPKTDYHLLSNCHAMIQEHCSEYSNSPEGLFSCLFKAKADSNFDDKCRNVVVSRAHLFGMDIRLNSELQRSCRADVQKHCKNEMKYAEENGKHEGLVIECLKSVYLHIVRKEERLEASCEAHIKDLIIISADDFQLDFSLQKHCSDEIAKHCQKVIQGGYHFMDRNNAKLVEDRGRVSDCLKDLVSNKVLSKESNLKCFKQVNRLIKESLMDIHADVKLHSACSADLKRFCDDVPSGEAKQLECLLVIHGDHKLNSRMKPKCSQALDSRLGMWRVAVPENEMPLSLAEVVDIISGSPASNYLFLLILVLVLTIFVMGLCLGRITKRLKREIKDR